MEQKINLLINVNYLKLHSHAISFLFSVAVQTQYTSFSGTKSSQYDVYIFVLLFVIFQTLQNIKKRVATNIWNIITLLLNSTFSFIIICVRKFRNWVKFCQLARNWLIVSFGCLLVCGIEYGWSELEVFEKMLTAIWRNFQKESLTFGPRK